MSGITAKIKIMKCYLDKVSFYHVDSNELQTLITSDQKVKFYLKPGSAFVPYKVFIQFISFYTIRTLIIDIYRRPDSPFCINISLHLLQLKNYEKP